MCDLSPARRHTRFPLSVLVLIAFALVAVAAPTLASAQLPRAGEEAPEFTRRPNWVWEAPDQPVNVSSFPGEVVIVAAFGCRNAPCLQAAPVYADLWERNKDRGLHMFMFELQDNPESEIIRFCFKYGWEFPVHKGNDLGGYDAESSIPKVWIVGVDGTIAFAGRPYESGFFRAIETEIAKVRFPGLGLLEIDRKLSKAGKYWNDAEFQRVRLEAQKQIEKLPDEPADDSEREATIRQQAQHMIDKATERLARLLEQADAAFEEEDYLTAWDLWVQVATEYPETPEAETAEERCEAMRDDETSGDILEAALRVQGIWDGLNLKNPAARRNARASLQQLADRNEDNCAGKLASRYIEFLDIADED